MLWQEKPDFNLALYQVSAADLSFRFECEELPIDHAWQLRTAVCRKLPWIEHENEAAIHSIHGASSGNGWNRPGDIEGSRLQLSKRTRLHLRLPLHRIEDARQLEGAMLTVGDYQLEVGKAQPRKLIPSSTLFARSVCSENTENEDRFMDELLVELSNLGITVQKMLCGLVHAIQRPQGSLSARSVLLADLKLEDSMILQQSGTGQQKLLGCGIYLPHKSLTAVGECQD